MLIQKSKILFLYNCTGNNHISAKDGINTQRRNQVSQTFLKQGLLVDIMFFKYSPTNSKPFVFLVIIQIIKPIKMYNKIITKLKKQVCQIYSKEGFTFFYIL